MLHVRPLVKLVGAKGADGGKDKHGDQKKLPADGAVEGYQGYGDQHRARRHTVVAIRFNETVEGDVLWMGVVSTKGMHEMSTHQRRVDRKETIEGEVHHAAAQVGEQVASEQRTAQDQKKRVARSISIKFSSEADALKAAKQQPRSQRQGQPDPAQLAGDVSSCRMVSMRPRPLHQCWLGERHGLDLGNSTLTWALRCIG